MYKLVVIVCNVRTEELCSNVTDITDFLREIDRTILRAERNLDRILEIYTSCFTKTTASTTPRLLRCIKDKNTMRVLKPVWREQQLNIMLYCCTATIS